jgi:hypothetical protein
MPITNPEQRLEGALAFLRQSAVRNFQAQAHARSILRHLSVPPEDLPAFSADIDQRVHYAAYYLLWTSLELLEAGMATDSVMPLLEAAAERLEFLAGDPRYDSDVQLEQLVSASFAYYLSGHFARSYVLLREGIPEERPLPPALGLLTAVLRKQLREARDITVALFKRRDWRDAGVSRDLAAGTLGKDDAFDCILFALASQAVSYFLEFPKNGNATLLQSAIAILDDAILIAREGRFVDWWWWLFCLRFLIRDFGEASLWTKLRPSMDGNGTERAIGEFIKAGLRRSPPLLELWPSQSHALEKVFSPDRDDFCLKMPTSSGKRGSLS